MLPASGLRALGTPPGSSVGFPGSSGWGQRPVLLSRSSGPGGRLLPASPDLLPVSLLCPQDPRSLEWASEGIGPGPRVRQTSLDDWAGDALGVLPQSKPPRVNPFPLSATLRGHWSCLASTSPTSSVPPRPTSSLGGSSCHLGLRGPPPASCRCPSCGETQTPRLPTLPYTVFLNSPTLWMAFLLLPQPSHAPFPFLWKVFIFKWLGLPPHSSF